LSQKISSNTLGRKNTNKIPILNKMFISDVSLYKIIIVNPTGLNVISKSLIFVSLPLLENLIPLLPTFIPFFYCF